MPTDPFPFHTKIALPGAKSMTPVGKLLCIGRNYAKHAAEMGSNVPDEPMVFLKPASALIRGGDAVVLPPQSQNVHHEVELVAVIGRGGRAIDQDDALSHVAAYAVGLDMTARDIQSAAKERRHPWSVAKGFDTFAPLGPLTPADQVGDPQNLEIAVTVNGEVRQQGHTRHMIFPVAELVHYCSQIFTLAPGDLLYTGTPDGVGPVEAGDRLRATLTGCAPLQVRVEHPREESGQSGEA
jgi:2-keto-4-pentenoate hydratase/2-oxohepta-3-ene-1,7-dioic acid hydratase in catechol pathway